MTDVCLPCEMLKQQHKNEQLEEAKRQAKNYGKLEKLDKVIVYERKNGSYSYCSRTDWGAKKSKFTLISVVFID